MLARFRKMQEENEEGFTLIELLVVIIIIGILAAIAIPVFLSQRQKGYDAGIKSDLRNAATAEESYLTDTGSYYLPTGGKFGPTDTAMSGDGMKFSNATDYDSTTGQSITVEYVGTAGTGASAGTSTNSGYCLSAKSSSGNTFAYNSELGGLQPGTSATCA